jgi:hypothetical protein
MWKSLTNFAVLLCNNGEKALLLVFEEKGKTNQNIISEKRTCCKKRRWQKK